MNDDVDQTMIFEDELNLLFPKLGRIVIQDVKQGIVLGDCDWQLDKLADKIRHHGATTATLRIKMRNVRNGSVIGKIEGVVPLLIAIENRRSKPFCPKMVLVGIYLLSPLEELFFVAEEMAVVIQIVNCHFKSAIPDGI